ncbi:MAG: hypothetical protein WCP59_18280, partial [Actinomycetota bacterium]
MRSRKGTGFLLRILTFQSGVIGSAGHDTKERIGPFEVLVVAAVFIEPVFDHPLTPFGSHLLELLQQCLQRLDKIASIAADLGDEPLEHRDVEGLIGIHDVSSVAEEPFDLDVAAD